MSETTFFVQITTFSLQICSLRILWPGRICNGFPGGSAGNNLSTNAGDMGSIPEEKMATRSNILAWAISWT